MSATPELTYLCKTIGGSRAYGLHTPESDEDIRGVFIHTTPDMILGLSRHDHKVEKTEEIDAVFHEARKFLGLLQRGNTWGMEMLYTDDWLHEHPAWQVLRQNRIHVENSAKLFTSLLGYMQGERRLAFGERTARLGKRKDLLAQYGFSPKNVVQLLRLAWAGQRYFRTGEFPVDVSFNNELIHGELMQIKYHPENFKVEYLRERTEAAEAALKQAFEATTIVREFDTAWANAWLYATYMPYLRDWPETI